MALSYKFSVYRTAAWTTSATGTYGTVVQFDTKTFDTGSNVDVTTNKGRFTVPVAGFYFFAANVNESGGASTIMYATLLKNGTTPLKTGTVSTPSVANNTGVVSGLFSLAANDYVEVYWLGGGGSTGGTGVNNTSFDGFLVSAT